MKTITTESRCLECNKLFDAKEVFELLFEDFCSDECIDHWNDKHPDEKVSK